MGETVVDLRWCDTARSYGDFKVPLEDGVTGSCLVSSAADMLVGDLQARDQLSRDEQVVRLTSQTGYPNRRGD